MNGNTIAGLYVEEPDYYYLENCGDCSFYNSFVDNRVNGDVYYHFVDEKDIVIEDLLLDAPKVSNLGKITLINCTNVTLGNLNTSNNYGSGVYAYKSDFNTMENITANSNNYGIYLLSSDNNTLTDSTANLNKDGYSYGSVGIFLYSSSNNTLTNNSASSNKVDGVYIYSSSNNILRNTNASSNQNGIRLYYGCNNNTISNNIVDSNDIGINLQMTNGNVISSNTINNSNTVGLSISYPDSYYNSIVDNKVNGDIYYHLVDERDLTIEDLILEAPKVSNLGKVSLINCTNITLRNINASNNYGHGIYLYRSNSNTVKESNTNSNNLH
jgi:parallel beta-helix repeat protein